MRKLYTPVPTRFGSVVFMLQMLVEYKDAVDICYSRNPDVSLRERTPTFVEWEVATKNITQLLKPVLKCCQNNQGQKHWLLSDAVMSIVNVYLDLKLAVEAHENVEIEDNDSSFEMELTVFLKRQADAILQFLKKHLNFLWKFDTGRRNFMFLRFY